MTLSFMQNKLKKIIWLYISSFGIMFALLSWFQEMGVLSNSLGWWKGGFAAICGLVLYLILPVKIDH